MAPEAGRRKTASSYRNSSTSVYVFSFETLKVRTWKILGDEPASVAGHDAPHARAHPFTVTVDATMPGQLAPCNFKVGGTQYVVAQFADGSYVLPPGAVSGPTSQRAQPGDEIVIYGIGFGPIIPDIPPGQLVEQSNSLADPFTISFGGIPAATVPYNGLAPNFMRLYQFNVICPVVPVGDTVPLSLTLGGASGTQTLSIAIGN